MPQKIVMILLQRLVKKTIKDNLEIGDIEREKAVLLSLIDSTTLDGDKLEIIPGCKNVTG